MKASHAIAILGTLTSAGKLYIFFKCITNYERIYAVILSRINMNLKTELRV